LIQFYLMSIGVLILVPVLGLNALHAQGLSLSQLPSNYFDFFAVGGNRLLLWFMLYFFGLMIGQDIWGPILSTKNVKVGSRGAIAAGVYGIAYAFAATLGGMVAYLIFAGAIESRFALPMLVSKVFPIGVAGLVLAGMLSAFMSTGDITLLAATTLIVYDVIGQVTKLNERKLLWLMRIMALVLGIFMIAAAVAISEVLIALDIAYLYLTAGLFIPTVVGLYWKRPSPIAAKSSIVCAVAVATAIALSLGWPGGFAELEPMFYGLLVSVVVYLVASFLRPSKPEKK